MTVGLPVRDLALAWDWYARVFELSAPDLQPAEGVIEFRLGGVWLQLWESTAAGAGGGTVPRFGVPDVRRERDRLLGLGVAVGPVEHVPDAVDYVDVVDPDGNELSLYSELG